jgi:hypothetical protein
VIVGHSDLGGKARVLLSGILDFYDVARCLFGGVDWGGCSGLLPLAPRRTPCTWDWLKRKKKVSNCPRELEELDADDARGVVRPVDRTTLGAALDAGERSGPRWTGDAWLARRRRYSTARRDRAHNLYRHREIEAHFTAAGMSSANQTTRKHSSSSARSEFPMCFRTLVVKIEKTIPIPHEIFRKGSISPELTHSMGQLW